MSPFTVQVPLNVPSAPVKVYRPPPLADFGWTLNMPSPVTERVSPALFCAEFGTSMKNMYEFDSLFGAVAVEAAGQTIASAAVTRNNSVKRRLICYLLCSPCSSRSSRLLQRRATLASDSQTDLATHPHRRQGARPARTTSVRSATRSRW